MKLFCNGCSFTEGYTLPATELNWPSQLGELVDHTVTNYALGGSSNDRIFRTTLEYLNAHEIPDLVVIGWTVITRAELSSQYGSYLRLTNSDCLPDNTEALKENFSPTHQFWLMNLYNEYINYRNCITYILHLQNYFQSKQINYRFFLSLGKNFINEFLNGSDLALELADKSFQWRNRQHYPPCKDFHTQYKDLVDLTNKIDLNNWITNNVYTMQSYLNEKSCATDLTGHFLTDGHSLWAQKIKEQL
jgi:hypothetical protein